MAGANGKPAGDAGFSSDSPSTGQATLAATVVGSAPRATQPNPVVARPSDPDLLEVTRALDLGQMLDGRYRLDQVVGQGQRPDPAPAGDRQLQHRCF